MSKNRDNAYFVYFSSPSAEDQLVIMDIITSNYISKRASENLIAVIAQEGDNAKTIHDVIAKKIQESNIGTMDLVVTKLHSFYGTLPKSFWDWVEEKLEEKDTKITEKK